MSYSYSGTHSEIGTVAIGGRLHKIVELTGAGNLAATDHGDSDGEVTIEAIGGGGSGGNASSTGRRSGGGSSGGYVRTSGILELGVTYAVVIGAGGAAVSSIAQGNNGTATTVTPDNEDAALSCAQGVGGGLGYATTISTGQADGKNGIAGSPMEAGSPGSGGGCTIAADGNSNGGSDGGTNGRSGGAGHAGASPRAAGGGAGAGGSGGNASANTGGNGGNGVTTYSGQVWGYGGGGGGVDTGGSGGGGGGAGGSGSADAQAGATPGSGGGGSGSGTTRVSGAGAAGRVHLLIPIEAP
ncbi:MAG: hypothetical protein KF729_38735 [Sandaracinaceae bacterium]|nr:hypothetical protein [Sandaracinaceae bacterium]